MTLQIIFTIYVFIGVFIANKHTINKYGKNFEDSDPNNESSMIIMYLTCLTLAWPIVLIQYLIKKYV